MGAGVYLDRADFQQMAGLTRLDLCCSSPDNQTAGIIDRNEVVALGHFQSRTGPTLYK